MGSSIDFAAAPPEERFWTRYNKRFEFPLSTILAVLLHALAAAFVVLALFQL